MPELKLRKSSEFVGIKPRAGVDPRELAERVTAALRAPDHHRLIGAVNPTAWVDREMVMVHVGLSASTPRMADRAQEMLRGVVRPLDPRGVRRPLGARELRWSVRGQAMSGIADRELASIQGSSFVEVNGPADLQEARVSVAARLVFSP